MKCEPTAVTDRGRIMFSLMKGEYCDLGSVQGPCMKTTILFYKEYIYVFCDVP